MNDYISRKDAIETIHNTIYDLFGGQDGKPFTDTDELLLIVNKLICKKVREIPAADVAEVVRCKDCLHNGFNCGYTENWCMFYGYDIEKDDYCSYGEREEDGKIH